MPTMTSIRFSRLARALGRLRRRPHGDARPATEHVTLAVVFLVATAAGTWLAGQFEHRPTERAAAPEGPPAARRPAPTAAVGGLPSYAAVPHLTLPQALAEVRPVPLHAPRWPRSRTASRRGTPATAGPPTIALVIDDMGHNMAAVRRAAALPAAVTLAFLPYVQNAPGRVAVARAAGKEIFLHMPMEPVSPDFDPGPHAIRAGLPAAVIRDDLARALARVPGAVGVNNHMGSRATADARAMRAVMAFLRERGLIYVDSWTSPRSVAEREARRAGILFAGRDVFLDNVLTRAAIRRQLMVAEAIARRHGTAIAIGHPHDQTLRTLEEWIPEARARGVHFAEVSRVVRMRRCPEARVAELCEPPAGRAVASRLRRCTAEAGC